MRNHTTAVEILNDCSRYIEYHHICLSKFAMKQLHIANSAKGTSKPHGLHFKTKKLFERDSSVSNNIVFCFFFHRANKYMIGVKTQKKNSPDTSAGLEYGRL